jgi:hypothetical protein
MQLIQPILQRGSFGNPIINLHYILFFLQQKIGNPQIGEVFGSDGFIVKYKVEVNNAQFGDATRKLVSVFQDALQINAQQGTVDEPTAGIFNNFLREFGGLNVERPEGYPFEVNPQTPPPPPVSYTVSGFVFNKEGEPLEKQKVSAFDIDLKGARIYSSVKTFQEITANGGFEKLGETETNADGYYEIKFDAASFAQAEKGLADVIAFAITGEIINGRSVLSTDKDYNKNLGIERLNIIVEETSARGKTEYTRLLEVVEPYLHQNNMFLSDLHGSDEQITFLARECEINDAFAFLLVQAAQLSREVQLEESLRVAWLHLGNENIFREFLYGVARNGITLSWPALEIYSADELMNYCRLAIEWNIITAAVTDEIQKTAALLTIQASQHFLIKNPAGGTATPLKEVLAVAIGNPGNDADQLQRSLLNIASTYRGSAQQFWSAHLPAQPGFANRPDLIKKIQLTGQLTKLTGAHLPLLKHLQENRQINVAKDMVGIKEEDWNAILDQTGLPDGVPGEDTVAKKKNFIAGVESALNAAYPTTKLASLIAGNDSLAIENINVREGLGNFFSSAPDFDLSTSRVLNFETRLQEAAGTHFNEAKTELMALQRMYQVSSSPEVMTTLYKKGLDSAFKISSIPEASFLAMHGTELGGMENALAVHQRSSFLTTRNMEIARTLSDALSADTPSAVMGDKTFDEVKKIVEANVPSYENIFGRGDSCECEHCKSVYSPSAYFIDLLRFLQGSTKNAAGKSPLDILLERRPDIGALQLTCENSNTLIPYIDLVNEIMEYFVANDKLQADAVKNVTNETERELRATPQFTNPLAYEKLKDKYYPFSLPYHQPLNTTRVFLQQAGISRTDLLKAVLKEDSLSSPAIVAETLLLSPEDYGLLTGKDLGGDDFVVPLHECFGYIDQASMQADIYQVNSLLHKTGLEYSSLLELVKTRFINPHQDKLDYMQDIFTGITGMNQQELYSELKNIKDVPGDFPDGPLKDFLTEKGTAPADIKEWLTRNFDAFSSVITLYEPKSLCELSTTSLRTIKNIYQPIPDGAPQDDNEFINLFTGLCRFIRLSAKSGYTIPELDLLITASARLQIDASLLEDLAIIKSLNRESGLPADQLAVFWGDINLGGKNSLYKKLFLSKTGSKKNAAFLPDKFDNYFTDTAAKVEDQLPAVIAAFRINAEQLQTICKNIIVKTPEGNKKLVFENVPLSLPYLSMIYRFVIMAKWLGISVDETCRLINALGINPFSIYDQEDLLQREVNIRHTSDFVVQSRKIQASGFSIGDVLQIIGAGQKEKQFPVAEMIKAIRDGIVQTDQLHKLPLPEEAKEKWLKEKLGLVYSQVNTEKILTAIKGNYLLTKNTDTNLELTIPASLKNKCKYDKLSGKLSVTGLISEDEKTQLQNIAGATDNFKAAADAVRLRSISLQADDQSMLLNLFRPFLPTTTGAAESAVKKLTEIFDFTKVDKLDERISELITIYLPYMLRKLKEDRVIDQIAIFTASAAPLVGVLSSNTISRLIEQTGQSGLTRYSYSKMAFIDLDSKDPLTDVSIDFPKTASPGESPLNKLSADHYSIIWDGFISSPVNGLLTLEIVVADAKDIVECWIDEKMLFSKANDNSNLICTGEFTFSAGRFYSVSIKYQHETGFAGVSLYWKSDSFDKTIVPPAHLFPKKQTDEIAIYMQQLQKALLLVSKFNLKQEEIKHLLDHGAHFDGFNFNALTITHWNRLIDYVQLRKTANNNYTALLQLFGMAMQKEDAASIKDLMPPTASLFRWNIKDLEKLIAHFGGDVPAFRNEKLLLKIAAAFRLIEKTKFGAASLISWSEAGADFKKLTIAADEIKLAVKAKYEEEEWMEIAARLSNRIRSGQRDALVLYLLQHPALIKAKVKDANGLFEYFLIDVQMGTCMDTSRIVQATNAIQLFITRCMLNLENNNEDVASNIEPDAIDQQKWIWTKEYRVWESNRQVFVRCESFVDPSWKMNKSPLFKALESELTQNDITADTVETAFRNYLENLNIVANLEICGVYSDEQTKVLHVVGRTSAAPYQYFYRTRDRFLNWSAWEKVDADIRGMEEGPFNGVHLVPVVWKKKLYLFWPEFFKKAQSQGKNVEIGASMSKISSDTLKVESYWEVKLAWSEYREGKWTSKNISKEYITSPWFIPDEPDAPSEKKTGKSNKTVALGDRQVSIGAISLQTALRPDKVTAINSNLAIAGGHLFTEKLYFFKFTPAVITDASLRFDLDIMGSSLHGSFTVSGNASNIIASTDEGSFLEESIVGNILRKDDYLEYRPCFNSYRKKGPLKLSGNDYLKAAGNHSLIFDSRVNVSSNLQGKEFFFQSGNYVYLARPVKISVQKEIKYPDKSPAKDLLRLDKVSYAASAASVTKVKASATGVAGIFGQANDRNISIKSSVTKLAMADDIRTVPAFQLNKIIGPIYRPGTELQTSTGYTFESFYHPFAADYIKELNTGGVSGLMNAFAFKKFESDGGSFFANTFLPNFTATNPDSPVQGPLPERQIDFDPLSAQYLYNHELFYDIPQLISNICAKNGNHAASRQWSHYIFDPTTNERPGTEDPTKRFWKFLPFRKVDAKETMEQYFRKLEPDPDPDPDNPADSLIEQWRRNPFNPHIIAKDRPMVYMKYTVIKYIENLISWGDSLFRRFSRESIQEALQMYIMAAHCFGRKSQVIPKRNEIAPESFMTLKDKWDSFSNALVQLENLFPFTGAVNVSSSSPDMNILGFGKGLYFCIPPNETIGGYWDTIEDRLYKIRHCQDINGIQRSLSLFAPQIDPAAIISALSKGMTLGGALGEFNASTPVYRFNFLLQKTFEMCAELKSLTGSYLSAYEKMESESMGVLRSEHELHLLGMVTSTKQKQVYMSKLTRDGLKKTREALKKRFNYYKELLGDATEIPDLTDLKKIIKEDIHQLSAPPPDTVITDIVTDVDVSLVESGESGLKLIKKEKEELENTQLAYERQKDAAKIEQMANLLHLIPDASMDAKPFGVGAGVRWGGVALGTAMSAWSRYVGGLAADYTYQAGKAAKIGTYIRREREWVFQANSIISDIIKLDNDIASAELKVVMDEAELKIHDQSVTNSEQIRTFLTEKFTGEELYRWMKDRFYEVAKQAYNMVFDMARQCEAAYCTDLGKKKDSVNFIKYGYWDSSRHGLTAGEQLHLALKTMENSYYEENRRELELTKHISLNQLDPVGLLRLKATGSAEFTLPEEIFDFDYPGHYFRRIKSVSITIPCVTGPYTTINATLRLLNNSIRINTSGSVYEHNQEDGILQDDDRFQTAAVPAAVIATSSAQNDSGVFELNFRDERYLPFEGAGVISTWKLELNGKYVNPETEKLIDISQLDYNLISDVLMHVKYTAKEEAGLFKARCFDHLDKFRKMLTGNTIAPFIKPFSLKSDFPGEFHRLLNGTNNDQTAELIVTPNHFSWLAASGNVKATKVEVFIKNKNNSPFVSPKMNFVGIVVENWNNVYEGYWHSIIPLPDEFDPVKKFNLKFGGAGAIGLVKDDVSDILIFLQYKILSRAE